MAIAIALAAGIGLYGWGKQQATAQTETSDALATQLTALQKAQESQKAELEEIIKTSGAVRRRESPTGGAGETA